MMPEDLMRSTIGPARAGEQMARAIATAKLNTGAVLRDARFAGSSGRGSCLRLCPMTPNLILRSDAKHRVSKDARVRAVGKRTSSIVSRQRRGQGIEPLRNHVLNALPDVLRRDPNRRAPLAAIMRKGVDVGLGDRRIGAWQRRQRASDPHLVEAGQEARGYGRVLVARPQIFLLKAGGPKALNLGESPPQARPFSSGRLDKAG